jgi:multidrug efflux pump subunit AcrA (membrane-fusion protein)
MKLERLDSLEPLDALDTLVEEEETGILPAVPESTYRRPMRRRRRRIWLIALIVLLLLGLIASGGLYLRSKAQSQVQYLQSAVTSGNLSQKVSATGPIAPEAEYDMDFALAGQVSKIDVQVGQRVKKGQELAQLTIDKTSLQNSITQDELSAASAQSGLNNAEQNLSTAKANATRSETSNNDSLTVASDNEQKAIQACQQAAQQSSSSSSTSGTGTPTTAGTINAQATATAAQAAEAQCEQTAQDQYAQSQAQTDQSNASAKNSITTAQQQVTSAQNSLNNAYFQLQTAQQALNNASDETTLVAPADATVAAINAVIGQSVQAGSSGNTSGTSSSSSNSSPLIVLADMSKLTISAQVNEVDIGNVQVGQTAQFTVAAYTSQTFRASVTAVSTIGETTSNVVNYTVQLTVDQSSLNGSHLYPGMTATVNITTAERIGVLLIPAAALSFPSTAVQNGELARSALISSSSSSTQGNGTTQGAQRVVLKLLQGKLVPVTITIGLSDGQNTEVLSGLQAGDEVVTGQIGGNIINSSTTTGSQRFGGFGGGGFGGGGGGGRSRSTP